MMTRALQRDVLPTMEGRPAETRRRHPMRRAGRRVNAGTLAGPSDRPTLPAGLALAATWSWGLIVVGAVVWSTVGFLSRLPLVVVPVLLALLLTALLHLPAALLRRLLPAGSPASSSCWEPR